MDNYIVEPHRDLISKLVTENINLFANGDFELCKVQTFKLVIDETTTVDQEIDDMLGVGVIKRFCSPWAFHILILDNKDGTKIFCLDF